MKSAVVLIIFNRPSHTLEVFNVVKKVKPPALFIVSDGPRNSNEKFLVDKSRSITDQIDWPCKVFKKYSQNNLGCRRGVASGLEWVFSQTDEAIILEDDCVPDPSFFQYCDELLKKYRDDKNIMMITGNNFFEGKMSTSYSFCRHSLIWGWASWKRAWTKYKDAEERGFKQLSEHYADYAKLMSSVRLDAIKKTLEGNIDTWDYIWQMALLMNNSYCIYPKVNLVKNTGFGKGATHTKMRTFHSKLEAKSIEFPLVHPLQIKQNLWFDNKMEKTYQPIIALLDIAIRLFQ